MRKTVVVDIDGTISKVGERLKYLLQKPKDYDAFYASSFDDEPHEDILELVRHLRSKYDIVFCTGRRESCIFETGIWLCENYWFGERLLMRENGDTRPDIVTKPELLEKAGYTPENVAFILEDRNCVVKKWRELGFRCLQVAEGDF